MRFKVGDTIVLGTTLGCYISTIVEIDYDKKCYYMKDTGIASSYGPWHKNVIDKHAVLADSPEGVWLRI